MALDLLEPTVADRPPAIAGAPRLADVRGKRLGFVDNSKCNADIFIRRLCNQFGDRFAVVPGPIVRKLAPKDRLSEADLSRLSQCDAVILCFGDCGTSTSINVADAVEIERRGIPTVNVFSTAFAEAARKQAEGRGLYDLPLVKIPHPMHTAPQKTVTERADAAVASLVEQLTTDTKTSAAARTLDHFDGANDNDDQEMLFARGWTDGLPVVFPTLSKVAAMVEASGRDANEQIGPIPPRWRNATIEKIAINAVMAGCRPDYFPVVLAAIEALLDNDCQLYGIQTATNTTAPLLIVNGPIVDKLGINARGNVFGQGVRANATIGRAVQLVLRNIGGDIAGETDMATHGQAGKFSSCIAEAEADSPWTPFHVGAGFAAADSTVTAIGASAPHNIFTYGCNTGQDILEHFIGAATALGHNNIIFPTGPLFVVSPEHAGTFARDGLGKTEIQNAIFERARIPLSRFAKRSVEGLRHRRSRWFAEVGDPDHIGVADRPEDINIVVAGGAGIHSLFVPTAFSYRPVTRRVARPTGAVATESAPTDSRHE
ncbi:MAG TPA: hypothetical protein VMA30_10275 [Xanthobacteraceae bacterium]|nr:hypothetical protein [Xanthobacteraceae bacterium]